MKLIVPLLLLLAFVPMMAEAGNTFDQNTNILKLDVVKTPAGTYTGVVVELNDYTVLEAKAAVCVVDDVTALVECALSNEDASLEIDALMAAANAAIGVDAINDDTPMWITATGAAGGRGNTSTGERAPSGVGGYAQTVTTPRDLKGRGRDLNFVLADVAQADRTEAFLGGLGGTSSLVWVSNGQRVPTNTNVVLAAGGGGGSSTQRDLGPDVLDDRGERGGNGGVTTNTANGTCPADFPQTSICAKGQDATNFVSRDGQPARGGDAAIGGAAATIPRMTDSEAGGDGFTERFARAGNADALEETFGDLNNFPDGAHGGRPVGANAQAGFGGAGFGGGGAGITRYIDRFLVGSTGGAGGGSYAIEDTITHPNAPDRAPNNQGRRDGAISVVFDTGTDAAGDHAVNVGTTGPGTVEIYDNGTLVDTIAGNSVDQFTIPAEVDTITLTDTRTDAAPPSDGWVAYARPGDGDSFRAWNSNPGSAAQAVALPTAGIAADFLPGIEGIRIETDADTIEIILPRAGPEDADTFWIQGVDAATGEKIEAVWVAPRFEPKAGYLETSPHFLAPPGILTFVFEVDPDDSGTQDIAIQLGNSELPFGHGTFTPTGQNNLTIDRDTLTTFRFNSE